MHVPHEDLMQRAVDGAVTADEREELTRMIASSSAVRVQYESLVELVRQLDAVPLVSGPSVRDAVLDRIRSRAPLPFSPAGSTDSGRRRRAFTLAWAAAAVLVIGIATERLSWGPHVTDARSAGAMTELSFDEWPAVARLSSGGSTLTVRRSGDRFALQTRVRTDGPIAVEWDPDQLSFSEAAGSADVRDIARGRVSFADHTKLVAVVLRAREREGTAMVRVTTAEREVFRWTAALHRGRPTFFDR